MSEEQPIIKEQPITPEKPVVEEQPVIEEQTVIEEKFRESKFIYYMKKIWPTISRVINIIVYAILNFIKSSIQYIMYQLKNS